MSPARVTVNWPSFALAGAAVSEAVGSLAVMETAGTAGTRRSSRPSRLGRARRPAGLPERLAAERAYRDGNKRRQEKGMTFLRAGANAAVRGHKQRRRAEKNPAAGGDERRSVG